MGTVHVYVGEIQLPWPTSMVAAVLSRQFAKKWPNIYAILPPPLPKDGGGCSLLRVCSSELDLQSYEVSKKMFP
jgi:hypothetical protein